MKFFIFLLFQALLIVSLKAQTNTVDSLKLVLQQLPEDTARVRLLDDIVQFYRRRQNDSALWYNQAALTLSQKLHLSFEERTLKTQQAELLNNTGNYAASLRVSLELVKLLENSKDTFDLYWTLRNIAKTHLEMEDYEAVIKYSYEIKRVVESGLFKEQDSINIYSMIGYYNLISTAYQKLNRLDSALHYMQLYYAIAQKTKDPQALAIITNSLGNLHAELGNKELSYSYHRMNLPYSRQSARLDYLSGSQLSLARLFERDGLSDSALLYAKQSLSTLEGYGTPKRVMESNTFLSQLYRQRRQYDSAYTYLRQSVDLKDSLFTQEKARDIQNQGYNELARQQELSNNALLEKEERKTNLQYVAIALGLVMFTILFLLLSSSIIANERIIKYLGIVGLLIVFEFINLLVHPYLAEATHHSPLLMLLVMVCIAALLVPAHHRLEKWITQRFIQKNKEIRLAAAKKTIASLETNQP